MTFRLAVAVLALGVLSACNKKCDATTCATGCCDAAGACVSTPTATACGVSGVQCTACGIGQSCQAGFCAGNGGNGGGGGVGGGGGGGATGGGGGSGGGSNTTYRQLLDQVYTAYCGYMSRCGLLPATDVATCAELYSLGGSLGGAVTAAQAANVGFTGDYTQCIADLGTISCEEGSSGPASCGSTPRPRGFVATGGACVFSSIECADVLDACSATCPRTCQRVSQGGNGQPCRRVSTGPECDTGLFCNSQLVCQAKGAAGASCSSGSECQSGTCSSQACVALPTAGQACRTSFPYCDANSWCNASDLCVASKSEGAACSFYDNECQSPLRCNEGTCRAPVAMGGACTSFTNCATDLGCDSLLHTCQPYVEAATGQSCTDSTRYCARNEVCVGVMRSLDGGVGTTGTCGVPVIGSACGSPYQCPPHATCDDGGHCVAATTGGRCSTSSNCLSGDYCNGSSVCTPRFATNAQCDTASTSYSSCLVAGDVCVPTPTDAVARCRPRGGVGAPCVNGAACSGVLACVNGACAASGHVGQPCFGGSYCVGGVCGADGGCQGPGGLDAGCYDFSQCQSGTCREQRCVGSLCP